MVKIKPFLVVICLVVKIQQFLVVICLVVKIIKAVFGGCMLGG